MVNVPMKYEKNDLVTLRLKTKSANLHMVVQGRSKGIPMGETEVVVLGAEVPEFLRKEEPEMKAFERCVQRYERDEKKIRDRYEAQEIDDDQMALFYRDNSPEAYFFAEFGRGKRPLESVEIVNVEERPTPQAQHTQLLEVLTNVLSQTITKGGVTKAKA